MHNYLKMNNSFECCFTDQDRRNLRITSPQVESFAPQLRQRHVNYGSLEETADAIRSELSIWRPFDSRNADLTAAIGMVRGELQDVEILRPFSIVDKRPEWYEGPIACDRH
ncbi:hypothetical protein [Rhodovulum sulfidophilum]|uniref:hypothetical protein n=1 Tax=Rhodovulum sulfidophilum TaxID=35806 RepID=UPI000953204A|nr:hypothetical protein [Rhodovulum sulfidophilum]MBL3554419.1 hypothetical protein [Rhodovulum sulfidophilum]OLS47705.1 hypothetical protein BV379_04980 [Rhodovulum sulfidophilum]